MREFTIPELLTMVEGDLGVSEWVEVDQGMIDQFADVTGDHQWIHVDPERAADGPFGGTVAHGFLTMSLLPRMLYEIYSVSGLAMSVNYGLNKVRFPAPTLAGTRVRTAASLVSIEQHADAYQAIIRAVVEQENGDKPTCVADVVVRMVPNTQAA